MVAENRETNGARRKTDKGVWFSKLDFLMSLVAYTVGLDNFLRFPYLCYKHNGGAFLVPYIICWLAAAMPIFFLEACMGQLSGEGGITMWKLCPLFKGVGIANIMIASLCSVYYCVIICWALFYIISSLTYSTLPYLTCNNEWNTKLCSVAKYNSSSITIVKHSNFTAIETSVVEFWQ
uniref:Uncharacterized protein n=1 Tax=Romanomermis culicivorax TaxID=13658 RepID=A0A915HLN4_ROMCU